MAAVAAVWGVVGVARPWLAVPRGDGVIRAHPVPAGAMCGGGAVCSGVRALGCSPPLWHFFVMWGQLIAGRSDDAADA